jgi:2'-5' RNA ligase
MPKNSEGHWLSTAPSDRVWPGTDDDPLIVTLALDPAAHMFFDALRTRYFPPERLQVGAHVTLFHAIPAQHESALRRHAAALAAATAPFPLTVRRLRFLGRGVAYDLAAPAAQSLRASLAAPFAGELSPQDSAPWSPHITIQNKVTPAQARQTQAQLATLACPEPTATGIALWRYRGGPWQQLEEQPFKEAVLF